MCVFFQTEKVQYLYFFFKQSFESVHVILVLSFITYRRSKDSEYMHSLARAFGAGTHNLVIVIFA